MLVPAILAGNWDGAQVTKTVLDPVVSNEIRVAVAQASSMTTAGCHVARMETPRDGAWKQIVKDGKPGRRYEEIMWPIFSRNGARLVYAAQRGYKYFVVLDEVEDPAFSNIFVKTIAMSADGSRLAYIAEDSGQPLVVLDGKVQECRFEPWITAPFLSANGKRFAFIERDRANRKMRMVIDGQPAPFQDGIALTSFQFSEDGKRYAYTAFMGNKCLRVIDDQPGEMFDLVGIDFVFSPDTKHTAYMGTRSGKRYLVMDGAIKHGLAGLVDHSITFSPDSQRLAMAVQRSDGTVAVQLDGKVGPAFSMIGGAWIGDNKLSNVRQHPGGLAIYHHSKLLFSPDSKRLAYSAGKGGKVFLVVDGQADSPCDAVGYFAFSSDSKHILCLTRTEERCFILVDGVKRASYDVVPAGPVFRDDGVIELIVQDENALQRIEVSSW
jgi:hypothetical protein